MNEYTVTQITDNNFDDLDARLSGNNIVWTASDGNDPEIFFYNGTETIQLTDNDLFDSNPEVSGNNLIWQQSQNNPFEDRSGITELIFYDGVTTTSLASIEGDFSPAIDGNNVVWGEPNRSFEEDIRLYQNCRGSH